MIIPLLRISSSIEKRLVHYPFKSVYKKTIIDNLNRHEYCINNALDVYILDRIRIDRKSTNRPNKYEVTKKNIRSNKQYQNIQSDREGTKLTSTN